jgi:hypothetical protein
MASAARPSRALRPTSGTSRERGHAAVSPAIRFLLEVARSTPPAAQPIPPGLDWDGVLRLAQPHGMEPLLIRRLPEDDIPQAVWSRIAAIQEENANRNLAATAELIAIVHDLEAAGIPAISYKGPVLALQLYGDVAARRFGDLDIVVRPSQVRAAREALRARGYVTEMELPGWQFDQFVKIQKEIAFIHHDTLQEVDLQWTLTERSFALRWALRGMWARSVSVDVAGTPVRTFSPEDLALVLCVHGTTHLWERLAWIADLGALVSTLEVDWPTVLERARQIGAERMVLASLEVADLVTGCGIPGSIAVPDRVHGLAEQIVDRVVSHLSTEAFHPDAPFHPLLARLRDSGADEARYVLRLLLTPTPGDWEAIALPSVLRPGYRVIRPLRLALAYGRPTARLSPRGGKRAR